MSCRSGSTTELPRRAEPRRAGGAQAGPEILDRRPALLVAHPVVLPAAGLVLAVEAGQVEVEEELVPLALLAGGEHVGHHLVRGERLAPDQQPGVRVDARLLLRMHDGGPDVQAQAGGLQGLLLRGRLHPGVEKRLHDVLARGIDADVVGQVDHHAELLAGLQAEVPVEHRLILTPRLGIFLRVLQAEVGGRGDGEIEVEHPAVRDLQREAGGRVVHHRDLQLDRGTGIVQVVDPLLVELELELLRGCCPGGRPDHQAGE